MLTRELSQPRRLHLLVGGIAGAVMGALAGVIVAVSLFLASPVTITDTHGQTGLLYSLASDPTAGGGLTAPLWQLMVRTDIPSFYYKSGAADTAWTLIGTNAVASGTLNTVAKFTPGSTSLGNSSATDDGTTFAINSTEFKVVEANGNVTTLGSITGGTSGQFTVTNGGIVAGPKITASGLSGNNSLVANFVSTGQTSSIGAISAVNNGTFNATAAGRTATGVTATVTATRSAGANSVTDIGIDTSASGGEVNWAARFNGGDVNYAAGHMIATGAAPTLSVCGATPSPSITGSDIAGTIVTGGTATTCTITFAATYGTAPSCILVPEGTSTQPTYTVAAGAISVSVDIPTTTYDYICVGH